MVPAERSVTVAIGHGKKASRHIDAWLRGAHVRPAAEARAGHLRRSTPGTTRTPRARTGPGSRRSAGRRRSRRSSKGSTSRTRCSRPAAACRAATASTATTATRSARTTRCSSSASPASATRSTSTSARAAGCAWPMSMRRAGDGARSGEEVMGMEQGYVGPAFRKPGRPRDARRSDHLPSADEARGRRQDDGRLRGALDRGSRPPGRTRCVGDREQPRSRSGADRIDTATAGDVASTNLVTVRSNESLARAAALMADNGLTHLIVLQPDSDQPVGVISAGAIAAAVAWQTVSRDRGLIGPIATAK